LVGRSERRAALIVLFASTSIARGAAAEESPLTIVAEVGTPLSSVRGRYAFASWLAIGPRFDLVETTSLRTGLETRATEYAGAIFESYTDVYLARAFGITVVGTWDAEINQWVRARVLDRWFAALRVGVIGYAGRESSQRGVVVLGAGRLGYRLDEFFDLGIELGRIGNERASRTLATFAIDHHF
jgi:hypothetical protein